MEKVSVKIKQSENKTLAIGMLLFVLKYELLTGNLTIDRVCTYSEILASSKQLAQLIPFSVKPEYMLLAFVYYNMY